jgi:hypothetical protein
MCGATSFIYASVGANEGRSPKPELSIRDRLSGCPHADSCACFHVAAPKRDRLLHRLAKVVRMLAVLDNRIAHAGRSSRGLC